MTDSEEWDSACEAFADLSSIVGQIRSQRPLEVSAEMRSLARKAAQGAAHSLTDDSDLEEWAKQLAESVSRADD